MPSWFFKSNRQPRGTYLKLGERGSGIRPKGEIQDYKTIKERLLAGGELFDDVEFPAQDSSLFYKEAPEVEFEWKRPREICDEPMFITEGASRFDIRQGELGDCWLLAAVANLTMNPHLFSRVVCESQSFDEDYCGIFHFRFWRFGKWVDVVVDDKLPTYNGRLVYMHSTDTSEFWSALLEKAYAKLHGSYEALRGGTTSEAMEDFTGGMCEMYELNKAPNNLYKILEKAHQRQSLLACSLEADPNILEARQPNGLIRGHAYSITSVKMVNIQTPRVSGQIPLLRIRNPWGNEAEWQGAWGDKSPEWRYISDDEKEQLGITFEADGEFWISFKDFVTNFDRLEICHLGPDSMEEDSGKKKWEMGEYEGSWVRGVTAGGCRNYLETFWYNPQYRVTVEDVDEDDDDNVCTVIVALMQKHRRAGRKDGLQMMTIGYCIYQLSDPDGLPKPLPMVFFQRNASVAKSDKFINLREVYGRFQLPPGTYCIVPSTFEPNEEGDFLLRVFSEKANDMKELDDDVGVTEESDEVKSDPETEYDEALKATFQKLAGEDLEVDAYELKELLDFAMKREFTFDGFTIDVCRSMVSMMDFDRSGKLGLPEFRQLWHDLRTWKNVFKKHDKDESCTLSTFELRTALQEAGYHVNWHILKILILRYGKKDGSLAFDDYIMCLVKLKSMIESFKEKDSGRTGEATFRMEEWLEKTMYT